VAAAAIGGFVAASLVVPSKEEQALKRLEKIERALHPTVDHSPGDGTDKAKDQGVLASIFSHAIKGLQPVLMSAITAAITGKMAQSEAEDLAAAQKSPPSDPSI